MVFAFLVVVPPCVHSFHFFDNAFSFSSVHNLPL